MSSTTERPAEYLAHYANKRLAPIAQMLADDVSLRDWNLSVAAQHRGLLGLPGWRCAAVR